MTGLSKVSCIKRTHSQWTDKFPRHTLAEYFIAKIETSVYKVVLLYLHKKRVSLSSGPKPHEAEKKSKIKTYRR